MKHIIFSIAVVASFASMHAHSRLSLHHGPLLIIDTSASNFGIVPNRGFVEHIFVLHNAGDSILEITAVHPSCGCTVASLQDSLIPVGSSTNLTIRLSAENKPPGGFEKGIYITSNSRDTTMRWLIFYGHFVAANSPSAQK